MKHDDHDDRDQRFDASMRRLHEHAVGRLPARTRLQLRQPRQAPSPRPQAMPWHRRLGWPIAASLAVALALVIGPQLRQQPDPVASTPPAPDAVTPVVAAADDDGIDTVLDENPDLYLWLASADADALVLE